jgi:hypothetical protein
MTFLEVIELIQQNLSLVGSIAQVNKAIKNSKNSKELGDNLKRSLKLSVNPRLRIKPCLVRVCVDCPSYDGIGKYVA